THPQNARKKCFGSPFIQIATQVHDQVQSGERTAAVLKTSRRKQLLLVQRSNLSRPPSLRLVFDTAAVQFARDWDPHRFPATITSGSAGGNASRGPDSDVFTHDLSTSATLQA